jgi:hypothetical protein
MSRTQRKLFIAFTAFVAVLIAATTAALAYAVRTTKRDYRGDIFDQLVSQQTTAWLQPTLICIGGALLVSIALFVGLWRFYSADAPSNTQ